MVKRWETFFCLIRELMKLGIQSLLRSPNKSIVPRVSFLNHDLIGPFKVAEKALHITWLKYP